MMEGVASLPVMPDGCYRASSIILSLPTRLPLDYGKMDSRLKLAGMTGGGGRNDGRETAGMTGRGDGNDGKETAGMTEGLTVRQLAQKLDLDLEEVIAMEKTTDIDLPRLPSSS